MFVSLLTNYTNFITTIPTVIQPNFSTKDVCILISYCLALTAEFTQLQTNLANILGHLMPMQPTKAFNCWLFQIVQGSEYQFLFFPQVFDFCLLSFLVPFALYLQQIRTRICHFAWYLLHCGMVTLHFAWYLLHLAMFAFHFAWYLPRFGTSTSHLHGICYILVLQTFMWDSLVLLQAFIKGFIQASI